MADINWMEPGSVLDLNACADGAADGWLDVLAFESQDADDGSNLQGMSQGIAPAASVSSGVQLDSTWLQENIHNDVYKKVLELSTRFTEFREKLVTWRMCVCVCHRHI